MNEILNIILLSILPISELRGAIPYGISSNINVFLVFILAVLSNCLVVSIVFFFLDNLHKHFLKNSHYKKFFNKYIEMKRKSLNGWRIC